MITEYNADVYWWEFIKMYMKIMIVAINVWYSAFLRQKIILTSIVLVAYFIANFVKKPYKMNYFYQTDNLSSIILILLLYLNLLIGNTQVLWIKSLSKFLAIFVD